MKPLSSTPSQAKMLGAILLLSACFTQPTHAHAVAAGTMSFTTGLSHPWSGWDHILAMVAVGLWGAQLGAPALWLLPVAFPMLMAFGGFLGLVGMPLPGIELCIASSAIVLGVMVALQARPPLWVAITLCGLFGLFHGHAHGTELAPGQDGLLYSIGFVIATGLLHATGIALGGIHRWKAGRLVLRAAGAGIAVMGCWFALEALA